MQLKDTIILNKISKLVEDMNYKSAYIEIRTDRNKYILEKENPIRIMGFNKEVK